MVTYYCQVIDKRIVFYQRYITVGPYRVCDH